MQSSVAMGMLNASSINILNSIPCFGRLSKEVLEDLMVSIKVKTYARGEILLREGERCPGLFIINSGSVKLFRSSLEGEEQIVRIIKRGGCFECVPFFDRGTNPVSAEALEETSVYFLPAAAFDLALVNNPVITVAFAPVLAARLRSLIGTIGDLSYRRVHPRLASLLCQLCEQREGQREVSPGSPLHQQHLACMLGCSRQVVNYSLRKLVKAGVIRMERRRIIIVDLAGLRKIK